VDKNTEEEALVIKCMDEVKSQYVDWYNLGYQTCMAEKKPWVGLTDDEITQCSYGAGGFTIGREEAMRAVEAKLKEKNNGG
jgi:hypothetical protein